MTQLDGKSMNIIEQNIEKLKEIFPEVFSEGKIDFSKLEEELGSFKTDENERYNFTWNGKSEAKKIALTPSTGTLRPCKEESKDWDTTQNLYIEGDNLEVLKLLQKSYHKKVKMIYIDPPYNTGKDFVYKDNFRDNIKNYLEITGQVDSDGNKLSTNSETSGRYHSDWLNMMYPRLKLARNLLKDDGVIFISIGEDEISNLEKICNEIFGEDNKIGFITRVQKKGSDLGTYFSPTSDYILAYAKNTLKLEPFKVGIDEKIFTKIETDGEKKGELYEDSKSLYQSSLTDLRKGQKYFIDCPDGTKVIPPCRILDEVQREGEKRWRWSKERYLKDKHLLVFKETKSSPLLDENGNQSKWNVYTKRYLSDAQEKGNVPSNLFTDFINSQGTSELKKLELTFSFAKPSSLISYLIEICNVKNEIVLDFFSGSATTAHSIFDVNNKKEIRNRFLLIQLPEIIENNNFKNICEIGKERIRRAGAKILEENKDKEGIENLDIGFRVFKVDSSNMKDVYYNPDEIRQDNLFDMVSNIKEDRTDLDLLFQVLLDSGVELTLPIEDKQIVGKKVYFVDGNVLAACFEDNLTEEFVTELAKCEDLLKVVFRDSSFGSDDSRINVEQIFKQYSPDTQIRVI